MLQSLIVLLHSLMFFMKFGIPDHVVRALDLRDNSFLDSFVEAERVVPVVMQFSVAMVDVNFPNQHAINVK